MRCRSARPRQQPGTESGEKTLITTNFYPVNTYLEVKVVHRVLIEGLSVGSGADFCDLLGCGIAKSDGGSLGRREGEGCRGGQQDELKRRLLIPEELVTLTSVHLVHVGVVSDDGQVILGESSSSFISPVSPLCPSCPGSCLNAVWVIFISGGAVRQDTGSVMHHFHCSAWYLP